MHVLATVEHSCFSRRRIQVTKTKTQLNKNTHLNVLLAPLKDGLVGVFLLLQARDHTS